jgi:hypothetical protein
MDKAKLLLVCLVLFFACGVEHKGPIYGDEFIAEGFESVGSDDLNAGVVHEASITAQVDETVDSDAPADNEVEDGVDDRPTWTAGNYKVIFPHEGAGADEYANWMLTQLSACSEGARELLGMDAYMGDIISTEIRLVDSGSGSYCCGDGPESPIISQVTVERFLEQAFSKDAYWRQIDHPTVCQSGHEEVHRLLYGTHIPWFANEGLATVQEERSRAHEGSMAAPALFECKAETYVALSFEGQVAEMTYVPLHDHTSAEHMIDFYRSAACFWNRLESEYGEGTIKAIVSKTADYRRGCLGGAECVREYVDKVIVPVVGDGVWGLLVPFGVGQ